MNRPSGNRYQPHEFARRAGVTVRTLHHYDRIGLLKPSDRTAAGFRLYRDGDFIRLQQIVTLKFIGFSLKEIKRLLDRKGSGLAAALGAQRRTLQEKRRRLDLAIRALARAENALLTGSPPDWAVFQTITEEIRMQTNTDWIKQYYSEEAQKLLEERKQLWSPELQKEIEEQWAQLIRDIEAAAAERIDPASPAAQALAERHTKLIERFTGGHAAIEEGLCKLWSDQENWPDETKRMVFEPLAQRGVKAAQGPAPSLLSPEGDAFLKKALEARKRSQ